MSDRGNMVERIEDAILNTLEAGDWDFLSLQNGVVRFDGSFRRSKLARAVIEALLEPTPEMIEAGQDAVTGWPLRSTVTAIYQAALRSILSQPNEGEGK